LAADELPLESHEPVATPLPADADESLSLQEHENRFGPNRKPDQQIEARAESASPPAETADADPVTNESTETETATETERDEKGRFRPKSQRSKNQEATPSDVPRIQQLTARLRAAEAEVERLRTSPALSVPRDTLTAPTVQATPKPTSEQFQDFGEYIEALTEWKTDQKLAAAEQKRVESEQQRAAQAEQQRVASSWAERVKAAKTRYPDFEQTALLADTAIPQGSLVDRWILEHKSGADILYYLQKHPNELEDLLAMPLFDQAESLTLLGQRINGHSTRRPDASTGSPATVVSTPAPRPPNPVRTGPIRSSDEPPGDDASLADHERFYVPRRRRGA
jgi:hypothetical protein